MMFVSDYRRNTDPSKTTIKLFRIRVSGKIMIKACIRRDF